MQDTMTIDVYDDACLAARIGDGQAENYTADYSGNCIINLEDFAEMAEIWLAGSELQELAEMATTWLADYSLTAPVAQ